MASIIFIIFYFWAVWTVFVLLWRSVDVFFTLSGKGYNLALEHASRLVRDAINERPREVAIITLKVVGLLVFCVIFNIHFTIGVSMSFVIVIKEILNWL